MAFQGCRDGYFYLLMDEVMHQYNEYIDISEMQILEVWKERKETFESRVEQVAHRDREVELVKWYLDSVLIEIRAETRYIGGYSTAAGRGVVKGGPS